jgi:hypothetical protein
MIILIHDDGKNTGLKFNFLEKIMLMINNKLKLNYMVYAKFVDKSA